MFTSVILLLVPTLLATDGRLSRSVGFSLSKLGEGEATLRSFSDSVSVCGGLGGKSDGAEFGLDFHLNLNAKNRNQSPANHRI
jgi:hypothetical protein